MDILKPDNSRPIGAPKDWDPEKHGDCGVLPVQDVEFNGVPFMRSHWRPSPAEMAALDAGGYITLDVSAAKHPVVAMGVEPAAVVPLESASRRIAIAVGAAVEAMLANQRKISPGSYLAVSPCQVDQEGVRIRWGMVKDPATVGPDFAHWTIIGPIDAEGTEPVDLPDLPDFLAGGDAADIDGSVSARVEEEGTVDDGKN